MRWRRRKHRTTPTGGPDTSTRVPLAPVTLTPPDDEEPRPKLSVLRVTAAAVVLGGAGYGGFLGVQHKLQETPTTSASTWFAPYVDVTLTPTYQFQSPSLDPARQTVLGFVVAASSHSCDPSWGGYYGLSRANQTMALTARLAELRSNGAKAIVSFGGQKNTSLAVACPTAKELAHAYQSVVDTYHLHAIDLDVEGAALDNTAARRRQALAVRMLEQRAAHAHHSLHVWLTLPVEPSGLQDNALSAVGSMLQDRVGLAGVNVMAMDFSQPPTQGTTMLDLVERSLQSVHGQMLQVLPRYGVDVSSNAVWRRLGVTVMIGQNDVAGERFTVTNAQHLRSFVHAKGIARVSLWSINRDRPCGISSGVAVLSNTCSGAAQSKLQFSKILSWFSGSVGKAVTARSTLLRPIAPDKNPADAPFPLWNAQASYPAGYKVVERGEIYQAKWYTSGQDPSAQYQSSFQSPWELLGPVLPTDHAPVIPSPAPGTYPDWNATQLYVAGRRVLYQGLGYQAKWPNQGVAPGIVAAQVSSSPWKPLYTIPGEPSPTG